MTFGQRLKAARTAKKMSQQQLGDILGVTGSSVGGYEKDLCSPSAEALVKIMSALSVDANTLFGWNEETDSQPYDELTPAGHRIGLAYENATAREQGIVEHVLEPYMNDGVCPVTKMVTKILYTYPMAAGIPMYAEDDFEHVEFPENEVPRDADFGIRVQGDSMEPTIADGAIVWIRKATEIHEGRIGVFMVDDSAVCKRFFRDENSIRLESDNMAYEPIIIRDFERFGVVGRVLEYR